MNAAATNTNLHRPGSASAIRRWSTPLLFLALAILDLSNLARSHSEAEDTPLYILDATTGERTFHPNHLLFGLVGRGNFLLWRALGYGGNAAVPMQVLSVAAGLCSVWLTYRIAVRAGVPSVLAGTAAGWLAFSFGFWVYSVEADTYLLPMPFLLAAVLLLLGPGDGDVSSTGDRSVARPACIGLLLATAALLHQQYVFAVPAVLVTLYLVWRRGPRRTVGGLLRGAGVVAITVAGLVAVAYLAVGFLALGYQSVGDVVGWARGHAGNGMWESLSPKTPVMLLVGFARSIVSINFLFRSDQTNALMTSVFGGKSLVEERYLAEHGISTPAFTAICLAVAAAVVAGAWLLVRSVRRGAGTECDARRTRGARGVLVPFAATYALVNVLAIMVWEPGNPEFWIAVIPSLVLLLAVRLAPRTRVVAASAVLVAALFVANFLGGVRPYADVSNDYWYMQNSGFATLAQRGDVVVTDCPYVCLGTLALITDTAPIDVATGDVEDLDKVLDPTSTGRILVSSWALDGPSTTGADAVTGALRERLRAARPRMTEIGRSGDQVIYSLPR